MIKVQLLTLHRTNPRITNANSHVGSKVIKPLLWLVSWLVGWLTGVFFFGLVIYSKILVSCYWFYYSCLNWPCLPFSKVYTVVPVGLIFGKTEFQKMDGFRSDKI